MAAQFQRGHEVVWEHLDVGHGVEGTYLGKETASRCVWAKCYLNVNSVHVTVLLYKHSEDVCLQGSPRCWLLLVGGGLGAGQCLQMCVCLLWGTVCFVVGESVPLLSVVQAKLFNSSHGIFLPDVAFVALESRQAVCG